MTEQEKYADKIAKLLAQAEGTDNPAEAETFTAKAQQLMTQYAISEAMVREKEGKPSEEIVEISIFHKGVYSHAHLDLGYAVIRHNNCRGLQSKRYKPQGHIQYIVGFESDVARVRILLSSLQIQCAAALTQWVKEGGLEGLWDNNDKTRARNDFMIGFAEGVNLKLADAETKGKEGATHEEAERSGVSEEEASESVALIVRSRKDRVEDWVDEKYGALRSSRSRSRYANHNASAAGQEAGLAANTSSHSLGSGGRALPRGN